MSITPEVEQKLWAAAGVSRISDIPGFPLPSHVALKDAVASGAMQLGIEFAAARDMVETAKSKSANLLIVALVLVTPTLAIGSLILAVVTGNWWALGGVVSSFLGQLLASPHNPAKHFIKLLVAGALLHITVAQSIVQGVTWVSFAFATSAIAVWILNRLAWNWAYAAVLSSEAFATHLFKTHNLHIRDRQGKYYDPV